MPALRRMCERDLAPLVELLADERVMRFLERPFSPGQAAAFLREQGLCEPPRVLAVEDEDGFCGYAIYHPYDERSMEVGWVLAPRAWGRGYATELTALLARRAATEGRGVVIEFAPENVASRRVAEKCGLARAGTRDGLEVWRGGAPPHNPPSVVGINRSSGPLGRIFGLYAGDGCARASKQVKTSGDLGRGPRQERGTQHEGYG